MPVNGDAYTDWMSIIDHCFGDFLEDMSQDSSYLDLLPVIAYIRVNRDFWSNVKSEARARRFEEMYA
jgi:predicted phosphohydrolase